ncbi:MAG: capsular biosynthesis protein [Pseudomonadota bacterium]
MTEAALRRILLLQGPASWFPTYLGRSLTRRDAEVYRILLCPGDRLFWRGGYETIHYRDRPEAWPDFVSRYAAKRQITDLVCLGDGRRWHRSAIDALKIMDVRTHVIEQGYLRPGWLTIEPDGTGGRTTFPKDWSTIIRLAQGAKPVTNPVWRSSFANFATMDVAYNLANVLVGGMTHPGYRTHALDGPMREWAGWLAKAVNWPARKARVRRVRDLLIRNDRPVFLFALQLETDFQIRLHGPREGLRGALERTIRNFAATASANSLLIVKSHPLDNGWAPWGQMIHDTATDCGVSNRVHLLEGGSLDETLPRLAGLVTVNSTAGLCALRAGVPVAALGSAIYDLDGLTHSGALCGFWQSPTMPNAAKVETFVSALTAFSQVSGAFDGSGAVPGAEAVAEKILAPHSAASRSSCTSFSERIETAS